MTVDVVLALTEAPLLVLLELPSVVLAEAEASDDVEPDVDETIESTDCIMLVGKGVTLLATAREVTDAAKFDACCCTAALTSPGTATMVSTSNKDCTNELVDGATLAL